MLSSKWCTCTYILLLTHSVVWQTDNLSLTTLASDAFDILQKKLAKNSQTYWASEIPLNQHCVVPPSNVFIAGGSYTQPSCILQQALEKWLHQKSGWASTGNIPSIWWDPWVTITGLLLMCRFSSCLQEQIKKLKNETFNIDSFLHLCKVLFKI